MGSVCTCGDEAATFPNANTHRQPNVNANANDNDNAKPEVLVPADSLDSSSMHDLNRDNNNNNNNTNVGGYGATSTNDSGSGSDSDSLSEVRPGKAWTIIITPPSDEEPDDDEEDIQPMPKKNPEPIDSTLDGIIQWKKVADFSALLPKDVKNKLWKGVFKNDTEDIQKWRKIPEIKKISKVLRTFVMLHLTRQYKKNGGQQVPSEVKHELPMVVRQPSKFISNFLKRDASFIDQSLITIFETLCEQCQSKNHKNSAKKLRVIQENYSSLRETDLQSIFNKDDFLKNAFLQYMLYAFQFKLDSMQHKNHN